MRAVFICAIVLLGLLDAGCLDSRPVHYYTIEPPPAPVAPATPSGPALLVGNISASMELQDSRIRYRLGANEVGAYQFQRWSERPGTMISESLVQALRSSGKFRSVMESNGTAAGDYQLRGKLYEFDEVDSETIQTSISLRVDLVDVKTRQLVWQHLVKHEEPVRSKNIQEVVASLDRNLQAVVKETAEGIGHFLEAQPSLSRTGSN
jgi:cholesterol transport system auxiliary component